MCQRTWHDRALNSISFFKHSASSTHWTRSRRPRGVCSKIHELLHYSSLSTRADNCIPAPRVRITSVRVDFDSQAPPHFHRQTPLA